MPRCRSPPFLSEKQTDKKEMEETLWQKSITFMTDFSFQAPLDISLPVVRRGVDPGGHRGGCDGGAGDRLNFTHPAPGSRSSSWGWRSSPVSRHSGS